jgi:hypothetical protein
VIVNTVAGAIKIYETNVTLRLTPPGTINPQEWQAPFLVSRDAPMVLLGKIGFFDRFDIHIITPRHAP